MQYRTLEPIRHNGHDFPVGTILDMLPADADPLLAASAIEPVHKPFAAKLNPIAKEPTNG